MRVLITGVAGFIGSHIADHLHADGHQIAGVDNLTTGRPENCGPGFEEIDICDRHLLYELANDLRPQLVIHCAASYSDPNLWHRDIDTNVTGTVNVTLAAQHHKARLIYFQTALPPVSSYAISKIAGEQYITLSGVPYVIFRLANVYGPRNLSGPIPTFYKRLTAGETCTVTDTKRELVYVDDLVRAVMRAVEDDQVFGKFDLCSGIQHPISDLYDHVAEAVGSSLEPDRIPAPAGDVPSMHLDPTRAMRFLDWRSTTPLADGIAETVSWYAEHGVTDTYTHLALKG